MNFEIILEQSDEGGYFAYVPELPECVGQGATIEEALDDIEEAIDLYLEPGMDDAAEDEVIFDEELFIDEDLLESCAEWGYNA
ncbi:MAG: type II toxin-antitoxin system HicB family antitoxin [Candidatus Schekmanbacteria bacterium]|nr:type II toxin-antitoxin system HicB family antitoxin [Candidatus Schekmanbacteria bacterium]